MTYEQLIAYIDGLNADGSLSDQDYQQIINYIISGGNLENAARDLIQIRRGNLSDLPSLAQGEMALALDSRDVFIGGLNGNINIGNKEKTHVKSFGAKGDGITDDTLAIQNALNSMIGGGVLYFDGGSYLKSALLTVLSSNLTIEFAPDAQIVEKNANVDGFDVADGLYNLKFIGVNIKGIESSILPATSAVFLGDQVKDVVFENCTFSGYTIGVMCNRRNEKIVVEKCNFYNMPYIPAVGAGGYGVVLQASKYCRLVNNYFDGTVERHHIYCGRNPVFTDDLGFDNLISNNVFIGKNKANYQTGFEYLVKVMGNKNVVINGNTFDGGVGHVMLTSAGTTNPHCENVVVSNNVFTNVSKGDSANSGVLISNGVDTQLDNIIISNNTIKNCDCYFGIRFNKGTNANINNNLFANNQNIVAIMVENFITNSQIINNQMDSNIDRGIQIGTNTNAPTTGLQMQGNILKGSFPCFLNNVSSAVIKDNEMVSSGFQCLYMTDLVKFTGDIVQNRFVGGNNGIRLGIATTDPVVLYGNSFTGQTDINISNTGGAYLIEPIKNPSAAGTTRENFQTTLADKPTTGVWDIGDIVWKLNPSISGYVGWICTAGGTPGTWKGFGMIEG